MNKKMEEQIQLRAEMTHLLIELNGAVLRERDSSESIDDLKACAIIILTASAALIVGFIGKSSGATAVIGALVGVILGLFLLGAARFSLASKLVLIENSISKFSIFKT